MKNNIIAISILSLVLGLSIAFNLKQRVTIENNIESQESLENSLYELSTERDSLRLANDSIQSVLEKYMFLVDSLDVLVDGNKKQIKYLNGKLNSAMEEINNMNPTEIYEAIVNEIDALASMVEGEEKYVFNEYQTKDIYKRIVKANYLDSIVDQQRDMVLRLNSQIINKDDIISTLQQDNNAKNKLLERLYQDLSNSTIMLDKSEADVKRLKKTLTLWKAGSVTAGGAIVLILLLL